MSTLTVFPGELLRILDISTGSLWLILLGLLVPLGFVGYKASPNRDLLIEGGRYDRPLIALERDPTGGARLFKHWDNHTKTQLRKSLYWDFLFIPIYSVAGAIACVLASRALHGPELLRIAFVFLTPLAGLFDVIENCLVLKIIDGVTTDVIGRIARVSTMFKFGLIGVAVIYELCGVLSWLCAKNLHH